MGLGFADDGEVYCLANSSCRTTLFCRDLPALQKGKGSPLGLPCSRSVVRRNYFSRPRSCSAFFIVVPMSAGESVSGVDGKAEHQNAALGDAGACVSDSPADIGTTMKTAVQ